VKRLFGIDPTKLRVPGHPGRKNASILVALVVVAAAMAWRLPGDVVARSLFQSSPPAANTPLPTATLPPSPTPSPTETEAAPATATPVPSIEAPATATPTPAGIASPVPPESASPTPELLGPSAGTPEAEPSLVPVESPTVGPLEEQPTATAEAGPAMARGTPPGFLPPPTLTSPGGPGLAPSLLPQPGPPLAAPPAPLPEPASQPEPSRNEVPSAAQLIDNALLAVSYVWLCCGVLALIMAAAAFLWLARRSKRNSRPSGAEGNQPDDVVS